MRTISGAILACSLFTTSAAFADRVVVLPFRATEGAAPKKDLTALGAAAGAAATERGHTLASVGERAKAEKSSKDGVFDTQAELVSAGKAAQVEWTLSAKVEARGGSTYSVDLEACQISSGRVESVARDIELDKAQPQIAEMLTLLLRPEGVAGAELPWKKNAPPPPPITPPAPVVEPPKPAPPPPPPVRAPEEPAPPRAYAEGKPFAAGIGLGVFTAVVRPSGAVGNATSLLLQATFGYAIESVRGLELRFDIAGGTIGPGSIFADGGARYALFVSQSPRLYLGPEAKIGAFVPFAGDQKARFFARGGGFVGFEATSELSFELSPNLSVAPGGSGALVFLDASLGAYYRF